MGSKRPEIGFCHLCAEHRELTLEHLPPQSAGNNKWTHVHTMLGLSIGSKFNKPPPLLECRSGMARRTLCASCNGMTARYYNDAFADWTLEALQYAEKVGPENRVSLTFRIQPLNVIKQIMTMALAAGDVRYSEPLRRIRRFVLTAYERPLPPDVGVRAYLNPLREERQKSRMLYQNRMSSTVGVVDIANGTAMTCLAEIAFPPMGYLIYFKGDDRPLLKEAAELADISFFGKYRYNEEAMVSVVLPVRIPFGPAPAHYPNV